MRTEETADNLIEQAKSKVAEAKSAKEDYITIPINPRYEINSAGIIRNKETKKPVTIKKGTGKFYLQIDADNNRKLYSPEELKESVRLVSLKIKKQKNSINTIKSTVISLYEKTKQSPKEIHAHLLNQGIILKIETIRWYISIHKTGHKRA